MLCPACEESRFPSTKGKSRPVRISSSSSSTGSGSTTKLRNSATQATETNVNICTVCLQSSPNCLTCAICGDNYDQQCSALSFDVYQTLLTIVEHTGWVCMDCRTTCKIKMQQIQSIQAKTSEQLADVHTSLAFLQQEIQEVKCRNDPSTTAPAPSVLSDDDFNPVEFDPGSTKQDIFHPQGKISMTIHRTLIDMSRRKRNVVVTGLPETDDDETLLTKFCEENLPVKPSIISGGCRRLGKKNNDPRPRRLLVQLTSETSATNLISAAKSLKNNDDEFARTIYINPDLTPTEAKMAYEKRQQRRLKRAAVVSVPVNNCATTTTSATLMTSDNNDGGSVSDSVLP